MYGLSLEKNLEFDGTGIYGTDAVHLGYNGETGALELDKSLVVGTISDYYYMGLLGLGTRETAFSAASQPVKSFITSLKEADKIPSSAYGYTAGAFYSRLKQYLVYILQSEG